MRFKRHQSLDEFISRMNGSEPKKINAKVYGKNIDEIYLAFHNKFHVEEVNCQLTDDCLDLNFSETMSNRIKKFYETKINGIYKETNFKIIK
jgi:hypothetical protein